MVIRNILHASCATEVLSPISGCLVALRGSKWGWFTTPAPPIGRWPFHALSLPRPATALTQDSGSPVLVSPTANFRCCWLSLFLSFLSLSFLLFLSLSVALFPPVSLFYSVHTFPGYCSLIASRNFPSARTITRTITVTNPWESVTNPCLERLFIFLPLDRTGGRQIISGWHLLCDCFCHLCPFCAYIDLARELQDHGGILSRGPR